MHIADDDLLQALRGQGMRITAPRRAICAALAGHHDAHLTVDLPVLFGGPEQRDCGRIDAGSFEREDRVAGRLDRREGGDDIVRTAHVLEHGYEVFGGLAVGHRTPLSSMGPV